MSLLMMAGKYLQLIAINDVFPMDCYLTSTMYYIPHMELE